MAAIIPGSSFSAIDIRLERCSTRRRPSLKDITPAATNAEYHPSCDLPLPLELFLVFEQSLKLTLLVKMASCAFSVFNFEVVPETNIAN